MSAISSSSRTLRNGFLSIQPTKFATPLDYAYYQYRLLDESLRLPPEKLSQQVAELEVFALQDLKNRLPNIVENQHPFVLTHTDLRPTNIIVDENMQIQGIIDWEWARTVPRQFFLPPTWIAGCPPDMVSGVEFRIEYRWLRDVLWADTSEHCRQLASEWNRKLPRRIDMSLAVIFGHHSSFVNAYYRGVFPMFYESSWGQEVKQFYECDGPDGKFSLDVQQRLRESKRYAQYLEKLGPLLVLLKLFKFIQRHIIQVPLQFLKLDPPQFKLLFRLIHLFIDLHDPFPGVYDRVGDVDGRTPMTLFCRPRCTSRDHIEDIWVDGCDESILPNQLVLQLSAQLPLLFDRLDFGSNL
ncbi:predicted protein [Chaetomium globosum CBS 148.51]|uniref:Aminoglycoside phosphotransferase domain-containing protein n=1 Tax=Chaetomium globosum (strain ATCC 6205 / CBS 148.51 / DSM 1962 / NBRC 6347 / NRRL 1970) TaxID=306901 RepID=Q2H040_CHAGB|nr:uncharacterized protein CHGG_04856 [Chaetomium globosum CBS 148.51]EAQ88237.1 predicted protein [Chaetomium globosum CBS 148.51]